MDSMNMNNTIKRLLALAFLSLAASLMLTGCADGTATGTTTSGTTSSGMTSGGTSGGGGGTTSGGTSGGGTAPCPVGLVCDGSTTPIPVTCPDPSQTFTQIPTGDAYVTHVDANGPSCINCSVVDAVDVIDIFTDNFAIMSIPAGILGSNSLTVTDVKTQFPAGSDPGFIVALPNAPVAGLSLLQTVGVTTISNGQDTTDTASPISNPVTLSVVGAGTGSTTLQFASVGKTTVPYNAARLTFGGAATISVLTQLDVYGAGVCQ